MRRFQKLSHASITSATFYNTQIDTLLSDLNLPCTIMVQLNENVRILRFPVVDTSRNDGSLILIVIQIIKERNEVYGIVRRSISKAEKQFPQLVF